MAGPPIIPHEAATAPATEAWDRADHGARRRYRRGCVRLLSCFALEVLLRLTQQRSKAVKKQFDLVVTWSVGRLGPSLMARHFRVPGTRHGRQRPPEFIYEDCGERRCRP